MAVNVGVWVSTCMKCGAIFNDHSITNVLLWNVTMIEF